MKKLFTLFVSIILTTSMWATTAYVSTYSELSAAVSNTSVDNIVVTANIDVPCETSVTSTSVEDVSGASTAQLVIGHSLTLQSQAGSRYIIKRTIKSGETNGYLKSLFSIRGDGPGNGGENNLAQNKVQVTFTNIIIDGGANFGSATVCDRYQNKDVNAYGAAGRAMIDIFKGGTLNLEDGTEIQNGYTTYSINSVVNNSGSSCYGGGVRVEYHANLGGGTINVKAGAIIHDCCAKTGYGGGLGAYNFARLNLYGGTIYNCSASWGGGIGCTYRSGSVHNTSATVKMYGGTIHDCCATNGGAISMDGDVTNYLIGGTIEDCSADKGGALSINESGTTVNIVAYNSHLLTISNCTNNEATASGTGGYPNIYKNESATIAEFPVYHVTFRDNNATFAVLSVAQGTSLGEAFPAAPAVGDRRFVGWYNGNTQVTKNTTISANITVTAKWDFLGSGTSSDPYLIPSTAAWDSLAHRVTRGTTFSGKYFQQTNNISITTIAGDVDTDSKPFEGTYDGNGNTFNLNLNGSGECTAPFIYIKDATIKDLYITGSVSTTGVRPASIASFVSGNTIITNCWSEVAISSSGYYKDDNAWVDAGAFVARVNSGGTLTLNGCLFTGSITYSNSIAWEGGGMVGWTQKNSSVTLNDCVFAPSAVNVTNYSAHHMFVGGLVRGNLNNCYYNDVANASGLEKEGKQRFAITAGNGVTISNLGSSTATYDVSGITAYTHGIKLNNTYFAGSGDVLSLNLSGSSNYKASAGTLSGSTLTMPASNVTIYGAATIDAVPSANSLTYNGSAQALVTAGTADGGTLNYSLDNNSWSASIPTGINATNYTVYYMVVGDATHADNPGSSVSVTINKAALSITADDKEIIYGDAAPTYTASYSGWKNNETTSVLGGSLDFACDYSAGSNVGDYTITPSGLTASNYDITFVPGTLTVNKADAAVTTLPAAVEGLAYTGSAQTLISAGTATGGEMQYKLDNGEYSTALPTATDVKVYTVYYKVVGDANHNDVEEASLEVTIGKPNYAISGNADPQHPGTYYSTFYYGLFKYRIPEGVEAYAATIGESDLYLKKIAGAGDILPEGTAVILKSTEPGYTMLPTDDAAITLNPDDNDLQGVDVPTLVSSEVTSGTCYVLSGHSSDNSVTGVGFYQYTGELKAHRAYVVVGNNAPKRMRFVFDTETGVESVQSSEVSVQKIIRDGQLIIIRGDREFNVQGQIIK